MCREVSPLLAFMISKYGFSYNFRAVIGMDLNFDNFASSDSTSNRLRPMLWNMTGCTLRSFFLLVPFIIQFPSSNFNYKIIQMLQKHYNDIRNILNITVNLIFFSGDYMRISGASVIEVRSRVDYILYVFDTFVRYWRSYEDLGRFSNQGLI